MLTIRPEQMQVFEKVALKPFEDEMVKHSREFTPRLCEVLGEEPLRVALRSAMERAIGYGFTNRGPMRLFIELGFLYGSGFDTDPQYPSFGKVLQADEPQMERAEQIHQSAGDYYTKVAGPENVHVKNALRELLMLTGKPLELSSEDFDRGIFQEMRRAFPQKAAYIGDAALRALIREGRGEARKYRFTTPQEEGLIVILMFAFGHGCTQDPLYPWIERTLKDERITDPASRAKRLEQKAVTWLEHVLASPEEGSPA